MEVLEVPGEGRAMEVLEVGGGGAGGARRFGPQYSFTFFFRLNPRRLKKQNYFLTDPSDLASSSITLSVRL